MYCTLHIAVHGNRVKPQSNSVATIFHSHSQRHSKHWLPSVFKGCHHQAILMTDKNGFALSAHRIMYSCRVSGMSGPAFGTIPHVSSSVCLLERNSALLFGIVLLWEWKNNFIWSVCIRNMNAGLPNILTSEQSAIWNWLIFKNCWIQRLSSNLFEKQHADALLRPSTEMQLKEVQTIFLALVITIFLCQ